MAIPGIVGRQTWIDVDGIVYETKCWKPAHDRSTARGSTPTLVFLHEGLGSIAQWRDFPIELVNGSGLPAVAYNRAGYGGSDALPLPWPASYMHDHAVQVLPALLERLSIRHPIFIGHSDGASIALIYAARQPVICPRALILIAPHVLVEEMTLTGIRAARDAYMNGPLRSALARYHPRDVDAVFWGWNNAWLDPDFARWDIRSLLAMIDLDILLIQGKADEYGSCVQLRTIEKQTAGPVQTVLFDHCGHAPHRDAAEASVKTILTYLDRVLGGD